jgi:hypothetical protein
MKKILLCLIAGVLSFYIGIFTQSLFYWENVKLEILPIEEQGIIIFDISKSACYPGLSSNGPKYLYLPFTGVGYGYYYNLPSSNGRHASLTDQQPFELESLTFNEQDFSFITKQIGNIKYSMEGKMPTGKNGNVIEGTLTKYRDGKIVFKRKVVFREAVPSC